MGRNKPRGADGFHLNDKAAMVVVALKKRDSGGTIVDAGESIIGPFKVSKSVGGGIGSYSGRTLGGLFVDGTGTKPVKTLNHAWHAAAVKDVVLVSDSINEASSKPIIHCFEGYIISETEQKTFRGRPPLEWRAWREIVEWDEVEWTWRVPVDDEWLKALK